MTKANYIDWENLRNIPFFLCQVVEDEQNQEIVLYYLGERVFHDYDHVGHYMRSAIVLFRQYTYRFLSRRYRLPHNPDSTPYRARYSLRSDSYPWE